jgi:hypothetical protein
MPTGFVVATDNYGDSSHYSGRVLDDSHMFGTVVSRGGVTDSLT